MPAFPAPSEGPGALPTTQGSIRLLGFVELIGSGGAPVDLPAELRSPLAVLALAGADPVSPAQLSAALSAAPPDVARLVEALARALDAAGLRDALVLSGAGYRLRLPCDAAEFDSDVRAAHACLARGDRAAAIDRLDAALGRWAGGLGRPPLAGRAVHGWAAARVARLREMRLIALEDRWECALRQAAAARRAAGAAVADAAVLAGERSAADAAAGAVAELAAAVRLHPLRERLWGLLLVAHFLAGRRGEAIAAYERAEREFAEQLGVAPGERLRSVAAAVIAGDVGDGSAPFGTSPAGQSPPATRTPVQAALPVPLTPLIGRGALLPVVTARLAGHRLVTLTGPGGSGKTRLAIAAAGRVAGSGAWFIDLSPVESPVRVPAAVAAALGVREEAGGDPVDGIAEQIGDAARLVVLDNCEHVLAGCAELVRRLLPACAALRVLATSRAPLGLPDEAVVAVPPLAVPAPDITGYELADLRDVPAARLFLDRAVARLGRPLPESDAQAVAALCIELDGMPLALELAAARTSLLTVPELAARLRADLGLLSSPDPTTPARHRTLAATVESSVSHLEPAARELFQRLALFPGGFDADAAAAVHDDGARLLPVLAAASLVEPAGSRFRMLSTVRRCAHRMLADSGDETAARRAQAGYLLDLAERADARLHGPDQERWLATLGAEWPNLRAALSWLAEAGAAGIPYGDLRLAAAVATYCHLRGHYRDAYGWLSAALGRHPAAPVPLQAKAATGAAMLAMLLCDYPASREHAERAREAYRMTGERPGAARVELILGSAAREQARYAEAAAHCDAAAALYAEAGDEWGEAHAVQLRGFAAWLAGDFDRAEPRLHACLRRFEVLGDAEAGAATLVHLGAVAHYRGDTDRAATLLDAGLERYAALGFPEGVAWAQNLRGLVDLRGGRTERAATHLGHSLAVHRRVGDRWRTASVLEALAEVSRLRGEPRRAAGLLAEAARIRADIRAPVPACERADLAATEAALRAALGEHVVDHAQVAPV
ncbi:MAG TPA: BTAD domain-containing putative transcriptional regulator [Pilimelia sp.]|nr:BTAD domain-containing putative transcriptional regulator [Pilimelia sp.]